MNLPISWLATAAVPAALILRESAKTVSTSVSHIFGEIMQQPSQVQLNGRSVAELPSSQNPTSRSNTERLKAIQDRLTAVAKRLQSTLGLPANEKPDIQLVADGVGIPSILAPDDLRVGLENYLTENPTIVQELNSIVNESSESDPLLLLPFFPAAGTTIAPNHFGRKSPSVRLVLG